jgi:hypothetical protein
MKKITLHLFALAIAFSTIAATPSFAMGKRPSAPPSANPAAPPSNPDPSAPPVAPPAPPAPPSPPAPTTSQVQDPISFLKTLDATITASGADQSCGTGTVTQYLSTLTQYSQVAGTETDHQTVTYETPDPSCDPSQDSCGDVDTQAVATVLQFTAPLTQVSRMQVVVYLSDDQKSVLSADETLQTLVQVNVGTLLKPVYQGQWQDSSTDHCGGDNGP